MRLTMRALFLIASCSLLATPALAHTQKNIVYPGFYLGVEGGLSDVNYKNTFAPGHTASSISSSGLATRIVAGFDITRYFGALLSVVYFHKPTLNTIDGIADFNTKIKNNLVFVALKLMLPIGNRFALSVSGGVGYVVRSAVTINTVNVIENEEVIRPMYGVGLAYLLCSRWAATLNWIQAPQKTSDHLPTSNFIGAGIRHKFSS